MILNRFEYYLMNNPVRAALQRNVEASRLLRLGGPVPGGAVLEIGCGRGVGIETILERFGAARVDGIDLDPRMVALARRRLYSRRQQVRVWQGDAARLPAPDNQYDAVFDFGTIHHIPQWRDAVAESYRVLKPGGRFYAEEVFATIINHPMIRKLLEHPQADRFNHQQFINGLQAAGYRMEGSIEMLGIFGWFVATRPLTTPEKPGH